MWLSSNKRVPHRVQGFQNKLPRYYDYSKLSVWETLIENLTYLFYIVN